jgi:hypothetical protein
MHLSMLAMRFSLGESRSQPCLGTVSPPDARLPSGGGPRHCRYKYPACPCPNDPSISAGIAGELPRAIQVACELAKESQQRGYDIEVIAPRRPRWSYPSDFANYNVPQSSTLSALIYRGPLAAAVI